MAKFDFTVDTDPMARKIDDVTAGVGLVGTAVTAMQAAVIASEKKASDAICKSIDGGFYMLLRSRLSQRIAQFASTMNSRAGSMMETAKAIDHTHDQMQGDFNRIKARYFKLFTNLDRSLEKRVQELDQDAMALAQVRNTFISSRQCHDAPAALFYASDIGNTVLKTSNALLKKKAVGSIEQLSQGTQHVMDYKRMTESVFEPAVPSGAPLECVPVVYSVAESQIAPNTFTLQVQTPEGLPPQTQANLVAGVRRGQSKLTGSDQRDIATIRGSFVNKVTTSNLDARVSQTMVNLFDASFAAAQPVQQVPQTQAGANAGPGFPAQGGGVR